MPTTRRRPSPARREHSRFRILLAAVVVLAAVALVAFAQLGSGNDAGGPLPAQGRAAAGRGEDPFAFAPDRATEYARRATSGTAHPLFTRSPGGAVATAARVAALRPLVDQAAAGSGVDPATLEAIVFLESAGRPDVQAASDLHSAVGLTQILAETGTTMLGMRVDVRRSTQLTRAITRATASRRQSRRLPRLRAERARVDERFDPRASLAGTVRYLTTARQRLGRDDLAVVAYHKGIGNLEHAIAAAGFTRPPSYAELFFGSTPTQHAAAWRILAGLGDESATYYWKVLAARDAMAMYRRDRGALERLAALQTSKASNENVLHPPDAGEAFADAGALRDAYAGGTLVRLPTNARQLGLRIDPQMGELAPRLAQPKALYRGLRPDALRLLIELSAGVRRISGVDAPLTVTSTVRDQDYQDRIVDTGNVEATQRFSVHTTGWSFDLLRRYANDRQAQALQFMLDRLQALGAIAWVREPEAIHVTVAGDVKRFVGGR